MWLNWPEDSFRLNEASLRRFEELVGGRGTVTAVMSENEFLRELPSATHAIVWEFRKEWFALAPKLRKLMTPGAGRELLPTDTELPDGVVRINGAFHGAIMSETVIACIFAHARGLYRAYDYQLGGELWPRVALSPYCRRVAGTKAVILGYGKIGHTVGAKLELLGVEVKGFGRKNIGQLKDALPFADWLIVALPSDTGTDNIVNAEILGSMKTGSVLINIGRGNAVDEEALKCSMTERHIPAAAFLDVFKNEPLKVDSPLAGDIPGLYKMPHSSAFSPEYLPMFFEELERNGNLD